MTAPLAPGSDGPPVLITGGGGFVGQYVVSQLRAAGYPDNRIVLMSRNTDAMPPGGSRTAACDLTNRRSVAALLEEIRPGAVIHLAAIALPAEARAHPDEAWALNFTAVRYLSEEILARCPEARLIFAGSAEAYGASFLDAEGPIPETAALRPMSTYGATKAAADILLGQMAWQGLKSVRFRAFNHTGPGQSPDYVVASFVSQVAEIEAGLRPPVLSVGNLTPRRDFLDVRDVARAYVLALAANLDFSAGPVFNLARSLPIRIGDVLDQLVAMSTSKIEVRVDPGRVRAVDLPVATGSIDLASTHLVWQPKIDLQATLENMLEYSIGSIKGS